MPLYCGFRPSTAAFTTELAAFDDGNRFVDVMMRSMKMIQNTRLQTLRVRIVFFLAAIRDGLVDQFA